MGKLADREYGGGMGRGRVGLWRKSDTESYCERESTEYIWKDGACYFSERKEANQNTGIKERLPLMGKNVANRAFPRAQCGEVQEPRRCHQYKCQTRRERGKDKSEERANEGKEKRKRPLAQAIVGSSWHYTLRGTEHTLVF